MAYYYSGGKVAWLALAFAMAAAAVVVTPCTAQNSTAEQQAVDLHNAARADVGVGPVTWDDTVAAFAQSYAAERKGDCALKHSDGGPDHYGENLFWASTSTNLTVAGIVGSWVAEKQWYDHSSNSCSAPQGESCLHYTQVVWRNSTAIGCGSVECDNNAGVFVTCNYNPAGNIEGESPY